MLVGVRTSAVTLLLSALFASGCALFSPKESKNSEPAKVDPTLYGASSRGGSHLAPTGATVSAAMGYASLTGAVLGHCVEEVETRPSGNSFDELEVDYAEDAQSLSEMLGVTANASAEFGFFSVSAEAEYVTKSVKSSSSTYLVVSSLALAPVDALVRYKLTESALADLREDPAKFYRRCGDQFVSGVQRGATFKAIAEIESASSADRDYLKAHARASYLGFGGGAGVEHEVESTMQRVRARFHVIQSGRQEEIPTFDQFVNKARTLNEVLKAQRNSGDVVRFETKPYDVAENWPSNITLPALVEQARTLEQLAHWHRTLVIGLGELREGRRAPKDPPCPRSDERFQREIANYDAARARVEERAHACVNRPMADCKTDDISSPPSGTPRVVSECSDLEAKADAIARADARRSAEGTRKQRLAAAREDAANRAAAACKGDADDKCAPCRVWAFSSLAYDAPRRKPSGSYWDAGGGAPDPVVVISAGSESRDARAHDSYSVHRSFDLPLRLSAGARVSVSVRDQDLSEHDRMASLDEDVPLRLPGGVWSLGTGSLQLRGTCVE